MLAELSSEAKLALAFPEMMSRQENVLPLLFADVKGRKVKGFQADNRIRLFNRAKLDENGAFVLFNLKPESDAAGNVPHRVIYSDGKGDKKNSIVVYRAQRNLWEDDKQLDIGPDTGVGDGEINGVYTSSTFDGNKSFIKALGRNETHDDTSLGYSYELVVGREDGAKMKEIVFENKFTLDAAKNLARVIRKNSSALDKKNVRLQGLLETLDEIVEQKKNMTWADFYYNHISIMYSDDLQDFVVRFLQDAGYDIIRRSKGMRDEETILLNQNLIREVRLLNVERVDGVDVQRIPFPYKTNDIFKGGRIVKLPVAPYKDLVSKIKRGVKGIIKAEEIDDDTISGMVIGGKYNEETGDIEGGEWVDMGIYDLIDNGIEPRVIHVPGIDKDFTEMQVNAMKFYYEMVLESVLTDGKHKMNLFGLLKRNKIYPSKAYKDILRDIDNNNSMRNMADYRVNKNIREAIFILDYYDKDMFNAVGAEELAETSANYKEAWMMILLMRSMKCICQYQTAIRKRYSLAF